MQTKVIDTAYTEVLEKRLVALKTALETKVTAENFSHMTSKALRHSGEYIQELKLSRGSNLNGFEISNIKDYIDYLKTMNLEYQVFRIDKDLMTLVDPSASTDLQILQIKYLVPEGWDGRNGFVFQRLISDGVLTSDYGPLPSATWKTYSLSPDQAISTDSFKISSVLNKKEVLLKIDVHKLLTNLEGHILRLDGYILIWRRK